MNTTIGNIKLDELNQTIADVRIPTLPAILDPGELGRYVYPIVPLHWGVLRDIEISVLQQDHRRRCTVDIRLQTTTGEYQLIGKVYTEDRSDVYRAMKQIFEAGFGPNAEFSIPQPLAFIPELKLLLQEKVQGSLATEIFLTGTQDECVRAAERCALWLAHFHAYAPASGRMFFSTREVVEHWMRQKPLEQWLRRIPKRAGPLERPLMDKAVELLRMLEAADMNHYDRDQMCACHGTYCHYQIILNETHTVTLDWDGFCVTHPALDVARFILVLQQLALNSRGSLNALDFANEAFYNTYVGASRFEVTKRLPVYKAAHCLKHSRDYLKRDDVRPEVAEIMLDEGLRILAEEI